MGRSSCLPWSQPVARNQDPSQGRPASSFRVVSHAPPSNATHGLLQRRGEAAGSSPQCRSVTGKIHSQSDPRLDRSVASAALPQASASRAGGQSSAVVRLEAFDDRVDRLWERARRRDRAMVVREQRYLNWRYCQRPDATYILYGYERGPDLAGFLVARDTWYLGMRWGYLVDFLAPARSSEALTSLIRNALADFRENGAAAASCIATDPLARRSFLPQWFFSRSAAQARPICALSGS